MQVLQIDALLRYIGVEGQQDVDLCDPQFVCWAEALYELALALADSRQDVGIRCLLSEGRVAVEELQQHLQAGAGLLPWSGRG